MCCIDTPYRHEVWTKVIDPLPCTQLLPTVRMNVKTLTIHIDPIVGPPAIIGVNK